MASGIAYRVAILLAVALGLVAVGGLFFAWVGRPLSGTLFVFGRPVSELPGHDAAGETRSAILAYGALFISSVTALASIFFGWRQDRRQVRDLELRMKELQIKMLDLQLKSAQASDERKQAGKISN